VARPEPSWRAPPRDGVGASRVGIGPGVHATLLHFLVARFPAVSDWPARLARGDVLDATGGRLRADGPCTPGTLLWYWRDPPAEARVPFEIEILFRDEFLVIVDKPHFLAVTPGGRHLRETVLVRLKQQLAIDTLAPMHRLDRDTAGVLAFTVQPATRHAYHALLRDRQARKVYEAIAPWRADLAWPLVCRNRLESPSGAGFMQMQVTPGEPNAETRIELIERLDAAHASSAEPRDGFAHYRLIPLTGRRHQLRAQMNALGLPIAGDRIYPHLLPEPAADAVPDYSQPLQLLARELSFTDPFSGQLRCFTSRRKLQHAR
jgi:tRNA pseudouridine32 synthase/23S rRNA pseudouridine746 synthase